jgi:hypothetical protein
MLSIATADIADNAIDGSKLGIGTTAGDTLYYDGTDWVRLGIGTNGQFLATNAGATAPEWISGVTTNLYTANGTLTGNRTITTGGNSLTVDGTGNIVLADSGDISTDGDVAVNGADITTSAATFNLLNANASTINFGGDATALNLGDAAGLTMTSAGALTINSAATTALNLDSGTTGSVSLGTGANAKTITIGNTTGATAVSINAGTGGSTYTTTNSAFALDTGTGAINLGTDAAAKTLTIGNSTGATAVTIDAGSGAI